MTNARTANPIAMITAGGDSRHNQHRLRDSDGRGGRRHRDKHREGEPDVAERVVHVSHHSANGNNGHDPSLRVQLPDARSGLLLGGAVDVLATNHVLGVQSQQHLVGHEGD